MSLADRESEITITNAGPSRLPKSFELLRIEDVFTEAGVAPGPYKGVSAELALSSGGDAVLGYCFTAEGSALRARSRSTSPRSWSRRSRRGVGR